MSGREVRGDGDARAVESSRDAFEYLIETGEDFVEGGDVTDRSRHRAALS